MIQTRAEAAGLSKPEVSDAYHATYTAVMREMGTPVPCACEHCRAEAELADSRSRAEYDEWLVTLGNPTEAELDEWADWLAAQANG